MRTTCDIVFSDLRSILSLTDFHVIAYIACNLDSSNLGTWCGGKGPRVSILWKRCKLHVQEIYDEQRLERCSRALKERRRWVLL